MHLNDEQLEDALAGEPRHDEHLAACADCRRRLAGQKATQARLRQAMAGMVAPADLAQRIGQGIAPAQLNVRRTKARPRVIRWAPALAVVAAVLVAVPVIFYLLSADQAQAAGLRLAEIHQMNLSELKGGNFYTQDDPEKLASYFKDQLHFSPAMPRVGQGLAMRGCCKKHFSDGVVGSYVVQTPSGFVSIIVVRQDAAALGLKDPVVQGGRSYYRSSYGQCNMVMTRLGDLSYCAVGKGDISHENLLDLLSRLVAN